MRPSSGFSRPPAGWAGASAAGVSGLQESARKHRGVSAYRGPFWSRAAHRLCRRSVVATASVHCRRACDSPLPLVRPLFPPRPTHSDRARRCGRWAAWAGVGAKKDGGVLTWQPRGWWTPWLGEEGCCVGGSDGESLSEARASEGLEGSEGAGEARRQRHQVARAHLRLALYWTRAGTTGGLGCDLPCPAALAPAPAPAPRHLPASHSWASLAHPLSSCQVWHSAGLARHRRPSSQSHLEPLSRTRRRRHCAHALAFLALVPSSARLAFRLASFTRSPAPTSTCYSTLQKNQCTGTPEGVVASHELHSLVHAARLAPASASTRPCDSLQHSGTGSRLALTTEETPVEPAASAGWNEAG